MTKHDDFDFRSTQCIHSTISQRRPTIRIRKKNTNMSGIAGRTNYSDWDKKTNVLLSDLEKEQEQEIKANKEALGHGKYANSEAEAEERAKAKQIRKAKKQLDSYKNREESIVQEVSRVLDDQNVGDPSVIVRITRDRIEAGKRVLRVTDTDGPGTIVLTQDLTHLKSIVPSNSKLVPKSYPHDAENNVPDQSKSSSNDNIDGSGESVGEVTSSSSKDENHQTHHGSVHGLIKISLTHLKNCTVIIKCKVITGLLEISHCENIVVKMEKTCTIVTVQADICENVKLEFHDVPSGKANSRNIAMDGASDAINMFWGEDKDDRVFHAGVKGLCIQTFRDGFLDLETFQDYLKNGAKQVGNVTAEEVQFVTSVVGGELVTERVLRQGAQTGTTVAGAVGGGSAGSAGRAMTEREMKQVREKKKQIQEAIDSSALLGSVKVVNSQGEEIPIKKDGQTQEAVVEEVDNKGQYENPNDKDKTDSGALSEEEDEIEEVYASMSSSDIDAIVQDCETQKARGNEAFAAGEYAQAVLLYTLTLDRASELPDATMDPKFSKKRLFARHVVLSNRSASFLKLGHHEKALKDATEAAKLDPTYVKAIFRKGLALHAMGRYEEAIIPLAAAMKMEPKNKQIKQALQFAEVRMHQELRKRMER
jgi:hypothetical protein